MEEITKINRKVRKMLMMHGMHHTKTVADRLYIKRRDDGRRLIELENAHNIAIIGLSKFIE